MQKAETMAEPALEDIGTEEMALRFRRFDAGEAWRLGCLIRENAARDGLAIAVEIELAGHRLFACALPGTSPDNADWIRRKRNTALRFHRSSLYMRLLCEAKHTSLQERYGVSAADFVASGGAVPIRLEGTGVVGTVVISGLPDVEDHRLAAEAMRAVIASQE